ncbi:MAG: glycosyltransferase family 2 protein [Candidatus Paceibacterota bacterium]|jgi:glycosyltransferase involved in cell wall biosynthesis
MISVIVPVYNEKDNVGPLVKELVSVVGKETKDFDIIIVDDGSADSTYNELKKLAETEKHLKVIKFSRNFGQTSAFAAGIEASKGDIIITIDGDLENDPNDIPKMLRMIESGVDLVSGWRKNRWQGQLFTRRLPSLCANKLISAISGVKLHDYGCMLKVYRREVIKDVSLYGEMHRFIPAYVKYNGANIAEVEVNYRPRRFGVSKYGLGRVSKVILDLLFIRYMMNYMNKPIRFFGGIGMFSLLLGLVSGLAAIILKIMGLRNLVATPLPIFSAIFVIVGIQLLVMGILAEMIMRTYYESQHKTPYKVKNRINF